MAPGSLPNVARLIASVSAASEILTLDGHGLELNQELTFRAESGGSVPSPVVAGTTYYAIPLTSDTFQITASISGPALNITTAGSNLLVIPEMPWAGWIDECSAMVDQTLPGHVVPVEVDPVTGKYPEPVRLYCAALLAMRALAHVGASTAAVQSQMEFWNKQTDKWAKGGIIRGTNAPRVANIAALNPPTSDARGWSTDGRLP